MKFLRVVAAVALLAGCNSAGTLSPSAVAAARSVPPDKLNIPLVYVSDAGTNKVYFYSWPFAELKGTLSGFGGVHGLCSGPKGNVYIVDSQDSKIIEYGHDATSPIATLYLPGYNPIGCAIDPVTGKLAVTGDAISSGPNVIAIFNQARGKPILYGLANIVSPSYCGFDPHGNLFIDGTSKNGSFALTEFPYGDHDPYNVTVDQSIAVPGGVEWDGKYLAIGDQGTGYSGSTIYQFTVGSYAATKQGTTTLTGSAKVAEFTIADKRIFGPNVGPSKKALIAWLYPAGGKPVKTIRGFTDPVGTAFSKP